MSNAQHPIEAAAVFGPGPLAHVVALRLARALPTARITLIRTPLDPAALTDRFPTTMPGNGDWLRAIGIDEQRLVAAGAATHRLGIRFADWGADAIDWTFAHGDEIPVGIPAPLHQLWLAHGRSSASRFELLVPGCALAASGRFVDAAAAADPLLASVDHGLRLDRARALPLLEAALAAAGIAAIDARAVARSTDLDGHCTRVTLDGARTVRADLFIDATGPAALLRPDDPVATATAACTRLLIAAQPGPPSPSDLLRAADFGWQAQWPLADRTVTMIGCDEDGREPASRAATSSLEEVILPAPAQRAPIAANVLALGEAGGALDPLGTLGFALALRQLDLFVELLPARRADPRLSAEFNRRARLTAERLAAFVAALTCVRPRRAGAYWRRRATDLPPGLAATVAQFAERGTLPHFDEESVSRHEWHVVLLGLGVVPRITDAMARSTDPATVHAMLARLAARVAALPASAPPYPIYLSHLTGAPQ